MSLIRPGAGPDRSYTFPAFERNELPNGLNVLIAPVHKLPLVTIHAVVKAGASHDPRGREGLAELVSRLIGEGTRTLSPEAFTEQIESLGSALSASADWDHTSVALTVMTERTGSAIRTLGEVLMHPALPEREFTRLREERLAELLQLRTEPRSLADEMFAALVYDESSRYSKPSGGSERSVRELTLEDAVAFHRARFTPRYSTIIVAGDVQPTEVLEEIAAVFGEWTGLAHDSAAVITTESRDPRRVHIIVKEEAPQSELRIGQVGVPRLHPDYFDIVVMNAILGGLFSSRINLNLRERRGFTYGAFSHFDWRGEAGPFVVSTAVKSEVTAAAVAEILGEVDRIVNQPVTDLELELAVSYLTGVFPIRFETTTAITAALAALVTYGLPEKYYDGYRGNIGSVTADRILRAARLHLEPSKFRIVVVGDPAVVRLPLEGLALSDLAIHDAAEVAAV